MFFAGKKDQFIVASALAMAAVVSVNAIMSYFKDPSQVDWSDPAPWFSLLNMNVVGSLVFLALVALERIN
eukprot:COSAG05_NODE_20897_length_276_cov_0.581921_1_plen_69_part_01